MTGLFSACLRSCFVLACFVYFCVECLFGFFFVLRRCSLFSVLVHVPFRASYPTIHIRDRPTPSLSSLNTLFTLHSSFFVCVSPRPSFLSISVPIPSYSYSYSLSFPPRSFLPISPTQTILTHVLLLFLLGFFFDRRTTFFFLIPLGPTNTPHTRLFSRGLMTGAWRSRIRTISLLLTGLNWMKHDDTTDERRTGISGLCDTVLWFCGFAAIW